jgi:hypothetical protein
MISKVITASKSSIPAETNYIIKDGKLAKILFCYGVRPEYLASDFQFYADLQPGRNKQVMLHCILSFPSEEKNIAEDFAVKLAIEYLNNLGFSDAPYCIISHGNTNHFHLHILTSFVSMNGTIINNQFIGKRGKQIAQNITAKYGLVPAIKKNLDKTNLSKFRKHDLAKYQLYTQILKAQKEAFSFQEFQNILTCQSIEIRLKYKVGTDNEIQGISFKKKGDDFQFKGSSISPDFSYGKLIKSFENTNEISLPRNFDDKTHSFDRSASNSVSEIFSGINLHIPVDREEYTKTKKKKKKLKKSNNNNLQM